MPKPALMKMSRLMIPIDSVTGKNSSSTCRTRGSRQSSANGSRNSVRRIAHATSSICTTVATSHAIA